MDFYINIFTSIIMGCLAAYCAQKRKRDPMRWFIIGLLLGFIGIIVLFILPSKEKEVQQPEKSRPSSCATSQSQQSVQIQSCKEKEKVMIQESTLQKLWFYLDAQHIQHGPIAEEQLVSLFKEGIVSQESYVWTDTMVDWKIIRDLPLLLNMME